MMLLRTQYVSDSRTKRPCAPRPAKRISPPRNFALRSSPDTRDTFEYDPVRPCHAARWDGREAQGCDTAVCRGEASLPRHRLELEALRCFCFWESD